MPDPAAPTLLAECMAAAVELTPAPFGGKLLPLLPPLLLMASFNFLTDNRILSW